MDNAQEEVPSRVWERCAQELDRRQKPVVLWWRRAAVSVAAAAAVAALVVTGIRLAAPADPDNRIAVVSEPEVVVEDIQTAEPEAVSGLTETTDNPMSQDIIPQDVSRMAASVQRPVSQRVTASEQETSAPARRPSPPPGKAFPARSRRFRRTWLPVRFQADRISQPCQ